MSTRLMTYDEAAAALGRSPEAVRQLCKRKRWRRIVGNDGKARISLPEEELAALQPPDDPRPSDRTTPGRPPDAAEDVTPPGPDARALIAELRDRIAELQGERASLREEMAAERTAMREAVSAQIKALADLAEELRRDRQAAEQRSWWPWKRRA